MPKATIDSRVRIVVPKEIRDALGLAPGDVLGVAVSDGVVRLQSAQSVTDRIYGRDRDVWQGIDAVENVRGERDSEEDER